MDEEIREVSIGLCLLEDFGDSGIIDHDMNKPIIEQYISSWDRLSDIGKTFVNTDFDIVELTPKYLHEMPC